eukprot:scaffold27564_cov21-Tisochrysis_lutea.AAC.1
MLLWHFKKQSSPTLPAVQPRNVLLSIAAASAGGLFCLITAILSILPIIDAKDAAAVACVWLVVLVVDRTSLPFTRHCHSSITAIPSYHCHSLITAIPSSLPTTDPPTPHHCSAESLVTAQPSPHHCSAIPSSLQIRTPHRRCSVGVWKKAKFKVDVLVLLVCIKLHAVARDLCG